MAATVLNTADLLDGEIIARSQVLNPSTGGTTDPGLLRFRHPEAGLIQVRNSDFAHMQIIDMQWEAPKDIILHETVPSDCIAINFMLGGCVDSQFRGLKNCLNMRAGTHNLIYTPESGHTNWMPGGQSLSTLLVTLDKNFFAASIGQDDAWSEQILTDLEHDRPFAGFQGVGMVTPPMRYLIDDIRNNKATGPLRNLLLQSRILELIAFEIEQFKTPATCCETIPADEVDKLHQLKTYLDANFLGEHSLAQLSRYCLLNEFKLKKGFKALFNITIFNYLRKRRMEYAGQLLRNGAMSVDEVADRLGYEHSQHFSIAFKKYTGLNPSQYQRGKSAGRSLPAG
ncbi:helix-turn-helix transcriptional regulator [Larkinella bovis]|uniref:Helix-turn-helix transcriptional regulator n=1 Tax=Larkinella bovis TaxID=683041 RepID=A0ABW0IA36_9BACT